MNGEAWGPGLMDPGGPWVSLCSGLCHSLFRNQVNKQCVGPTVSRPLSSRCPTQTPQDPHSAVRSRQLRETPGSPPIGQSGPGGGGGRCPPHSLTAAPRQLGLALLSGHPEGPCRGGKALGSSCLFSEVGSEGLQGSHCGEAQRPGERLGPGAPASGETVQALWENEEQPGRGALLLLRGSCAHG